MFASAPFATEVIGEGRGPARILSIGLGAGTIANFFLRLPKQVGQQDRAVQSEYLQHDVTSVELDPTMAYMAKRWFNVTTSPRHSIHIEDGVAFLKKQSNAGTSWLQYVLRVS